MDKCYKANCELIFAHVASHAANRFGVSKKFRHLDTTSMSVHGDYDTDSGLGLVTFGHSKDHAPHLKQFMISLLSTQDGDVPLLAKTIAGNHLTLSIFTKDYRNFDSKFTKAMSFTISLLTVHCMLLKRFKKYSFSKVDYPCS